MPYWDDPTGGGDWTTGDQSFPQAPTPDAGAASGAPPDATAPASGGGQGTVDQLKALIGSDYSPGNLTRLLPQLQALGIKVQNQARGDLRPRFLLPDGTTWDFGPGGWVGRGNIGDWDAAYGGGGGAAGGGGTLFGGSPDTRNAWLQSTPGYQFSVDQALQGMQHSAAARGTLLTGGFQKQLANYIGGMASQNYGNEVDRYMKLLGQGQNAIMGAAS